MIVNPNESPSIGIVSDTTGKMPRWKKILFILLAVHLVFTLFDACVFHGPCASWLIGATEPGYLVIEHIEYRCRPRQNEIVMTWKESVRRGRTRWGEGEQFSRTIPLDPMPEEFTRCYVDITFDQNAPAMIPMMHFGSEEVAPMPYFSQENVIGTIPEEVLNWNMNQLTHLPPEMVFQLRIRREDLPALSKEFYLHFSPNGSTILLPYSRDGNGRRVMLMATNGIDPKPYYDEIRWDLENHPHKMPSELGSMLKRIVLMPFVVIPDYVLDIIEFVGRFLFISWWAQAWK